MSDSEPSVADLVVELGGVATRAQLLERAGKRDLNASLSSGAIARLVRGVYAVPTVDESVRVAARLGGSLGLTSAAMRHGWAVKNVPERPHLMFSRGRRLPDEARNVHVHRAQLATDDVVAGVTSKAVTLAHCLRRLPFDEALCVADSALRAGFPRSGLLKIGDKASGPGSPQMRRVSREASKLSANVFESTMRAEVLDILSFNPKPQVTIRGQGWTVRPDLVDARLGIALEADSFEWHGSRAALSADARKYDLMVAAGWLVLRFSYEHVMTQPDFVRRVTTDVVVRAERMREVGMRISSAA